jgi:thioredoxin-related protein
MTIRTMKKLLLSLSLVIVAAACSQAQKPANDKTTATAQKPADKNAIPPFRILTTDSVFITSANLKKGKPVMVVYFSPDCSHCQRMMYEFKPKMAALKNIQLVMITWSPNYDIRAIKVFKRDFDLLKYPNVTIGTEGHSMTVQQFYDVRTTPYVAIYDKQGKLSKKFDKVTPTDTIIAAVKKV